MAKAKTRRLRLELAVAYWLPLPALLSALIWTAFFLGVSYAAVHFDRIDLLQAGTDEGQPPRLSAAAAVLLAASIMLGVLPAVLRISAAADEWDLRKLIPPADSKARRKREMAMLREESPPASIMRPFTVLGVIVGVVVVYWILGGQWELLARMVMAWMALQMMLLMLLLFRGIGTTVWVKKRHKAMLEAARTVDLLDLNPQHTVARMAMRTSLTHLTGAALTSLFLLAGGPYLTEAIMSVATIFALMTLLPPILRMQALIRTAKREAIVEVHGELQELRNLGDRAEPGRLADRLSYLHYLESLPVLPFDKGRVAVATLYFAVPLASWVWVSAIQRLLNLA